MALGQSYDCPSAIEATLKDMVICILWFQQDLMLWPQQNKAKPKFFAYFVEYTLFPHKQCFNQSSVLQYRFYLTKEYDLLSYINGLVQDCINSNALAMELL